MDATAPEDQEINIFGPLQKYIVDLKTKIQCQANEKDVLAKENEALLRDKDSMKQRLIEAQVNFRNYKQQVLIAQSELQVVKNSNSGLQEMSIEANQHFNRMDATAPEDQEINIFGPLQKYIVDLKTKIQCQANEKDVLAKENEALLRDKDSMKQRLIEAQVNFRNYKQQVLIAQSELQVVKNSNSGLQEMSIEANQHFNRAEDRLKKLLTWGNEDSEDDETQNV